MHTVTALTRQGSTNKIPVDVKSTFVDYDDEASLVSALEGQQFLITMAVTAPRHTQNKLVRAAAKAGVPYIMPNWYGCDFANKELGKAIHLGLVGQETVDEIESLGVSQWAILACGFWYEFSLAGGEMRYGFDFRNKSVTFFDDGKTKINTSTWSSAGGLWPPY
jgi:NmrA-like family